MLKKYEIYLLELTRNIFRETNPILPVLDEKEFGQLIALIDTHGMSRHLIGHIPSPYAIKLKTKFRLYEKRCRNMFVLASDFFKRLSANKVSYALIKGVYLSYCAYQNPYYRLSQDIDILIPPSQKNTVAKLLIDAGYIQGHLSNEGDLISYSHQEKVFYSINTHQTAPFIKIDMEKNEFSSIDINFNLTWGENRKDKINIEKFCGDTKEFIFNEISLRVLPLEKCLIQYCLHLYKDMNSIVLLSANQGFKLSSFCDVYNIIKCNKSFDFKMFVQMLYEYNITKYVYKIFYYTSLVFQDESILTPFQEYVCKLELTNTFGLEEDEIQAWPVPFFEYLFAESRMEIIRPFLTAKQLQKIEINKNYL
jgi:hypothetical protein